ncbi:MAG: hypothetical protein ABEJ97_00920 [Halobellus sp.]
MTETTDAVRDALDPETREAFERRVESEAESLRAAVRDGAYDTSSFAVGLELEGYVIGADGALAPAPEHVFEIDGCSRELGLHNAELHTAPDVVSDAGFHRQFDELRTTLRDVRTALEGDGRDFLLDAMWTVEPPAGTRAYLDAGEEVDGVFLAANMRSIPRYVALDQAIREANGGSIQVGLPGLDAAKSMLVESLATSMQPHLQIPDPDDVPQYLNAATRTMGPLLSLSANSPFLPADCYAGESGADVLDRTPHELRIPIFERSVDEGSEKCRVPQDVETIGELIDRVAADPTLVAAPEALEAGDEVRQDPDPDADPYPAFSAKRGTYWRWVRPVFGGDVPRGPDDEVDPDGSRASVRIEYRPLPTQPTLRDTVGMQALVAGVLRGVGVTEHPLATLSWEDARESFYAAVESGPDADLHWVTREGEPTTSTPRIYDELFSLARRGLDDLGVGAEAIEWALAPIEARRGAEYTTPSAWKRARVREARAEGADLPEAVRKMQSAYVDHAAGGVPFAEW